MCGRAAKRHKRPVQEKRRTIFGRADARPSRNFEARDPGHEAAGPVLVLDAAFVFRDSSPRLAAPVVSAGNEQGAPFFSLNLHF